MSDNTSFAERFAKKSPIAASTGGDSETSNADKYKSKNSLAKLLEKNQPAMSAEAVSGNTSTNNNPSVDPMKASKADLIYLVKGVDDNRNAWYYVLVERLKLSLFLKALNDEIIHLENYGQILYSAYGDEPPQDVTDKLKLEYGIK